jgi:hypothetical protein
MSKIKAIYAVKDKIKEGVCRLCEDDKPCKKVAHLRGLCQKHYSTLLYQEKLEEYGAPTKIKSYGKITINKKVKSGCCRLVIDGVACTNSVGSRGLCMCHYKGLKKNDLLDKYALPSTVLQPITRKSKRDLEKAISGKVCIFIEGGTPCEQTSVSRGACQSHFRRDRVKPLLLDKQQ